MSWNAIAAIAELVGAVGVVTSLLYLSMQVRQNTRAMRTATFQNIIGFATGFAESIARDAEMSRIFQTGITTLDGLNGSEHFRFHFQMIALLRRYENVHYQSTLQLLGEEDWAGLRASLDALILQPGSRKWWDRNASLFNPRFRAFIDARFPAGEVPNPHGAITAGKGEG